MGETEVETTGDIVKFPLWVIQFWSTGMATQQLSDSNIKLH